MSNSLFFITRLQLPLFLALHLIAYYPPAAQSYMHITFSSYRHLKQQSRGAQTLPLGIESSPPTNRRVVAMASRSGVSPRYLLLSFTYSRHFGDCAFCVQCATHMAQGSMRRAPGPHTHTHTPAAALPVLNDLTLALLLPSNKFKKPIYLGTFNLFF